MDEKKTKIGVYVCHCGGNISDVVDIKNAVSESEKLSDVVISRENVFMCSDPGQKMVEEDIKNNNLDRVVIAACSPSLHKKTFQKTLERAGLNPYLYEHANIREQVSWCSKSDKDGATKKSTKLIAAAVGKAGRLKPLHKTEVEAIKHVLIIGAGISGLRASKDLSKRGFKVTLIEKSPFIGGRMAQLGKVYPTGENAKELLGELMAEVVSDPNISIQTSTEVVNSSGYIGNFQIELKTTSRGFTDEFDKSKINSVIDSCPEKIFNEFEHNLSERKAVYIPYKGCYPDLPAIDWPTCTKCNECKNIAEKGIELEEKEVKTFIVVGSIILATGYDNYQPSPGEYGYEESPRVITLPQLIRLMDKNSSAEIKEKILLSKIKNVVFIHCVGSRQVDGINKPGSDGKVNDYCSRVCCTATLQAACELKKIYPNMNVFDLYQDIRTYGRGHEDYYEESSKLGVTFLRWTADKPPIVDRHNKYPLIVKVNDTLTFNEEIEVPADLVVLSTGMMPRNIDNLVEILKIHRSSDRFLQEVHPKLRPVELSIGGIMIAGTCQAPMDINETTASASTAAVKAASLLAQGKIELDPFVADINEELCTGGKDCNLECVSECAHKNAISIVDKEIDGKTIKVAEVNKAICLGCGMCVAVCPSRAIEVNGWQIDQFEAMIDAIAAQ
jgi:heterodisulfide reductase subunit A2